MEKDDNKYTRGGICWFCWWGWPQPVAEIYLDAYKKLRKIGKWESVLHWSGSHIVWEDENFHLAERCLEDYQKFSEEYSEAEKEIARESLRKLAALDRSLWDVMPEDYDGKDPEKFPPPEGVKMVFVHEYME